MASRAAWAQDPPSPPPVLPAAELAHGTSFSEAYLLRVPTGRQWETVVARAPGVTGGLLPHMSGAASNENRWTVEGFDLSDPYFGELWVVVPVDATRGVDVWTSRFAPQHAGGIGGGVDLHPAHGTDHLVARLEVDRSSSAWSPADPGLLSPSATWIVEPETGVDWTRTQASATISGPLSDRLTAMAAVQASSDQTDYEGHPVPLLGQDWSTFGDVDVDLGPDHRLAVLGAARGRTRLNTEQDSPLVEPEAQGLSDLGSSWAGLRWSWRAPIGTLQTSLSALKMHSDSTPVPCSSGDAPVRRCAEGEAEGTVDSTTPARYGLSGASDADNLGHVFLNDFRKLEGSAQLQLSPFDLLGRHAIGLGLSASAERWDQLLEYNSDRYYFDILDDRADPTSLVNYYWVEIDGPLFSSLQGEHGSLWVQDAYAPASDVLVVFGTRYDHVLQGNDAGERVVDSGLWAPRLSLSWAPGGGTTRLFAGAGRFVDPGRLDVASFTNHGALSYKLHLGEAWGQGAPTSDYNFAVLDTGEPPQWAPLTLPRSDEVVVGAQRVLPLDVVAGLFGTARRTRHLYEDDELDYIWDEDGYDVIGSTSGSWDQQWRLRTPAEASRDHLRLDLEIERAWDERWLALASWSLARTTGTQVGSITSFMDVPGQDEFYQDGATSTDVRHQLAIGAAWDSPAERWTTRLGLNAEAETGVPLTWYQDNALGGSRLTAPVGTSGRAEGWWQLDARVQQAIPAGPGKLWASAEVTNLSNNRAGVYAYPSDGGDWVVLDRQDPRIVMLGLGVER